jgi:hypothetical protein
MFLYLTANKNWRQDISNIPDLPTLLVVPVNLVDQVVSEMHRFLQYGSFDLFPYLHSWPT